MSLKNHRVLRHTRQNRQNLMNNSAHQFASQYALSIYESDSVFTFIPKNACSTMRYTIGTANGAICGPQDFAWIHKNNTTFRAALSELAKAKYTFAILRDPYMRIGSCYLDKMVDQTEVAWKYNTLTNFDINPPMLTFRQFIKNLALNLRGDEHWRPQTDFLVYENYDDLFCIEAFPHAIATLREKIGLEILDARGLTKHGADQYELLDSIDNFSDVPAFKIAELKRSGKIPNVSQLYDRELIDDISRIYAGDIEFYIKSTSRACLFEASSIQK